MTRSHSRARFKAAAWVERILFVAGLCTMAFLYGGITMQYQIFPYRVLKEAKLGLEAWTSIDRSNRRFPRAFEKFEVGASHQPDAKSLSESVRRDA